MPRDPDSGGGGVDPNDPINPYIRPYDLRIGPHISVAERFEVVTRSKETLSIDAAVEPSPFNSVLTEKQRDRNVSRDLFLEQFTRDPVGMEREIQRWRKERGLPKEAPVWPDAMKKQKKPEQK
jgi:hypothetical protein